MELVQNQTPFKIGFTPTNEMGVVHLFSAIQHQLGCRIVEIGSAFPDAKIEKDGRIYNVEFEYKSSNFVLHKHDASKCDLVICWIDNISDSEFQPIIIELSSLLKVELPGIESSKRLLDPFYWMQRAINAERRIENRLDYLSLTDDSSLDRNKNEWTVYYDEELKCTVHISEDCCIHEYA